MSIRIVIVEDDEKVLDSIEILLDGSKTIKVVATYLSGEDAINGIPDIHPDCAIVDLELLDIDITGIDVTREIKRTSPGTDVLIFTKFEDDKHLFSALKAGAVGYLLKDASPQEIIDAIEEAYKGGAPMSRRIARRLMEEFHGKRTNSQNGISLTPREKEILTELAKGYSCREVAESFLITYESVRTHLKHIYKKLHAHSRVEAISKAREKGVIFG